jgi:hypothetical protein
MLPTFSLTRLIARLLLLVPFAALVYYPSPGLAAGFGPSLGAAARFAALAGGAVTCTASTITGAVGYGAAFANTACAVRGTVSTPAAPAYRDFLTAYDTLHFNTPCDQTLAGTLAGVTLGPGVYCFPAAATLAGTLTLNGPANGVWIFKIGTNGTGALTGTGFSVVMAGGAAVSCPNVYWWVAQAATLTSSNFAGTILAGADITVTGGTFTGDALAGGAGTTSLPTGAVTLTNSTVTACPPQGGNTIFVKGKGDHGRDGPEVCDPRDSKNHDRSDDEDSWKRGNAGRTDGDDRRKDSDR